MQTIARPLGAAAALAALLLAGCAQTAPATSAAPAPVAAQAAPAKAVPGDAAIPIVELMPVLMRYEVDLKLTPEQIKALADYRAVNMPKRIAGQKHVLALRGQLRAAMLAGQSIPICGSSKIGRNSALRKAWV